MRDRLVPAAALAIALGLLAGVQIQYFERGLIPGDAFVYLAAGERLNAGHLLYALSPGDRPVDLNPPLWTVPLVSPPPIAVLWRPLAALPNELGVYVWWAAQVAALGTTLVMLARRQPVLTAAAMVVLLIPTVYEIGVGNVNSFLLLGLVMTWRWTLMGLDRPVGIAAAAMTAVKLTPGVIGWWLLVTGRRRAFAVAFVAGIVILGVSVAGAGLPAHLEYLRILGDRTAVGTSPLSLGGMARFVGVPDAIANVLPTVAALAGLGAVFLLRRRPDLAYGAAIITMILGSPAVSIPWYVLCYALLAPIAWPWRAAGPAHVGARA